jgi:uncharacterized membrane protein YdbT with pleckstrin-like domain
MRRKSNSIKSVLGQRTFSPSLYLNAGWYLLTVATVFLPFVAAFFAVISLYKTIELWVWTYEFADDFIIERKGILVRTTSRIEYSRIKSVVVEQHLLMQLVGIGNVRLITSDSYLPVFLFRAINEYALVEDAISSSILSNRKNTKRVELDFFNT